jgi:hypothetical protein
MNRKRMALAALVVAMATAGCDKGTGLEPGQPVERASSALLHFEPLPRFLMAVDLIGRGLNGMSLNGKVLDDRFVVAVSLEDVRQPKGNRKDLKLTATSFLGGSLDLKKNQREVVGMTFDGTLDDGDPVPLRIAAVVPSTDPASPYLRYAVSYPSDGRWESLCGVDETGAPVLAIPLAGLWNYHQGIPGGGSWAASPHAFTFACEGFVLAKCVGMGYAPWVEGRMCDDAVAKKKKSCVMTSLAPHHHACARMLRADFCGDGTPFTSDGTWVNAYDGIGIRIDSEAWPLEAEWDAAGARCAVHERLRAAGVEPPCMAALVTGDCGAPGNFERGTLIMSESDTVGVP